MHISAFKKWILRKFQNKTGKLGNVSGNLRYLRNTISVLSWCFGNPSFFFALPLTLLYCFHVTPVCNKQLKRGIWTWSRPTLEQKSLTDNLILWKYALTGSVYRLKKKIVGFACPMFKILYVIRNCFVVSRHAPAKNWKQTHGISMWNYLEVVQHTV